MPEKNVKIKKELRKDIRCIWMQAGVISYKLCSLDFRCEDCELDRVLRGRNSHLANGETDLRFPEVKSMAFEEIIGEASLFHLYDYALIRVVYNCFSNVSYSPEVRYSPDHLWVFNITDDTVRIGLDDFIGRCLDPVEHIVFQAIGDRIRERETVCWLFFEDWNIRLSSPVAGRIRAINSLALQQDPKLIQKDCFRRGWLFELEPESDSFSRPLVEDTANLRQWYNRNLLEIFRNVAGLFEKAVATQGVTMSDGGRVVTCLRKVMGRYNYIRLVKRLLKNN